MTTRLRGKETHFPTLQPGQQPWGRQLAVRGELEDPLSGGTRCFWPTACLEILQRFMHLEVKEKQVKTDKGVCTVRKETMFFPRHHQLDSVRKTRRARQEPTVRAGTT